MQNFLFFLLSFLHSYFYFCLPNRFYISACDADNDKTQIRKIANAFCLHLNWTDIMFVLDGWLNLNIIDNNNN